jgi:membrane protein implicated in regulation of membrane protease activity
MVADMDPMRRRPLVEKNGRSRDSTDGARSDRRWSLAALGIVPVAVLCCGAPAFLAAGGLAVIGGWLGAHGFWIAAAIALAVAVAACGRWRAARRRCAVRPSASTAGERR